MPIKFNCAQCNKSFTVADSSAGKTGRCSDCGNLNKIPAETVKGAEPPSDNSSAMFEVMSSVNGSVFGPADRATLQQWMSENRITPSCQIKAVGTNKWVVASQFFPSLNQQPPASPGNSRPVDAAAADPFDKFKSSQTSPVVATGNSASTVNPFEAGTVGEKKVTVSGEIAPKTGEIGFIIGHAFSSYKENFGIVFGCFLLFMALSIVLSSVGELMNQVLGNTGQAISAVVNLLVSSFLGAGICQILLKVGRGERVEFGDMFDVKDRWLPVIGYTLSLYAVLLVPVILIGIVVAMFFQGGGRPPTEIFAGLVVGFMLLLSVVMLLIWPSYFLIVDRRAGVFQAFGLGFSIAKKNVVQSFVIFLVAALISWAGLIAFCIGIVVSAPLGMLVVTSAYLNMSGQIRE